MSNLADNQLFGWTEESDRKWRAALEEDIPAVEPPAVDRRLVSECIQVHYIGGSGKCSS